MLDGIGSFNPFTIAPATGMAATAVEHEVRPCQPPLHAPLTCCTPHSPGPRLGRKSTRSLAMRRAGPASSRDLPPRASRGSQSRPTPKKAATSHPCAGGQATPCWPRPGMGFTSSVSGGPPAEQRDLRQWRCGSSGFRPSRAPCRCVRRRHRAVWSPRWVSHGVGSARSTGRWESGRGAF